VDDDEESVDGVVVPMSDDDGEEPELVSEEGRVVPIDDSFDDLESGEGVEEFPSVAVVDKGDPGESVLESPVEVADVVELTSVGKGVEPEPASTATVVQFVTGLAFVVKSKLLSFLCWPTAPEDELVF